jgi:TetR/AcrR family transcriptional regulator, mexJK operon transcriptional repressor
MEQVKQTRRRPRLAGGRLDELLDVAAEVFIADGFQGASTNVIAQRAGASKGSLYSRFPTKEDLFLAVLERRMDQIFERVAATIPPEAPPRDALLAFGKQILVSVFNEDQIALIRAVSMETGRFPQLGVRFFELGPGKGLSILSRYFAAQVKQGTLRKEDPQMMARYFFGMLGGLPLLFAILGVTSHLKTPKQRSQHLEGAVHSFLLAYKA